MRPYLFLDVDGVLNAWMFDAVSVPADAYTDFEIHPDVGGFTMVLSQAMGRDLAAAAAQADVRWLTTWGEQAAELVAPLLSLPQWPALEYVWLKAEAIAEVLVTDPRPFVWLDDVEAEVEQLAAVREVLDELPDHLLVKPNPDTGLTPSQIRRVAEWVDNHRAGGI